MAEQVVAIHPESTPDPKTLRWVVSHRRLPFVGTVSSAPGLDELTGVVQKITARTDSLLVTLAAGRSWQQDGSAVRSALGRALSETTRWQGGDDSRELDDDAALAMFATELIDGPIGEIARAHGGSIELVSANKGVVSVRMSGACRGCPAAAITMHQRLEHQLRRRFPDLREVVEVGGPVAARPLPLSLTPGRINHG